MEASFRNAERKLSPLAIVAIFVSLAETVLGILVTQTSEFVQLLLAVFAIGFPSGVALAFFLLLTFRPEHFYAPWEYPSVESMRVFRTEWSSTAVKADDLQASIKESVTKVVEDPKKADQVIRSIQSDLIYVDMSSFLGKEGYTLTFPFRQFKHVQALLDSIWVELSRHGVESRSYGESWILKDIKSGRRFQEIGSKFARKQLAARADLRSLQEVGILPGIELEVIKP